MGALVVYAQGFVEERHKSDEGREFTELEPIGEPLGGGSLGMSYASCRELTTGAAALDVDPELWPNYIESDGYDIPLQELRDKNRALHTVLATLSPSQRESVRWLGQIWEILDNGMLFYISH